MAILGAWAWGTTVAGVAEPDSIVEIPIRVPLAPLYAEVERLVPLEVRRDREWREHRGVKVRYAARRGPLELQARGDTLFLRTTVGYWLEARKPILGLATLKGSCGVNEPPRAVVLSLAVHLAVGPDWQLAARPMVLPPAFPVPCRMTKIGIDVTDIVGRVLHDQLWRTAEQELAAAIARLGDGRARAEAQWRKLQAPLALDDDTWLVVSPEAVWATQPMSDGRELSLTAGLASRLRLVAGSAAPAVQPTPLPALNLTAPRQPATRLPFQLAVSFADAAKLVEIALVGQRLTWGGKSVRVEAARLKPGSDTLTIEALLSGDLAGTVRLSGKPAFDPKTRELYLAGLDYEIETGDTLVHSLDAGLHDLIRGAIAARARWPLGERIAAFQQRAEQAINRALPAPFRLRASVSDVALTDIHLSESAIVVKGSVEGKAEVVVD